MTKFIENMTKPELLAEIDRRERLSDGLEEDTVDWCANQTSLQRLRKALKYVGDSGLTYRQKVEQQVDEIKPTRKWTRSSVEGQYGRIPVYESGDFSIRSVEGSFFVYKGHDLQGLCHKLSEAKAFVEFLDKKLANHKKMEEIG